MQTERKATPGAIPVATEAPVIIIGAGPAGLSLGYELKRLGIRSLILEKGPGVASSFRGMYKSIFFGPWVNNMLWGSPVPWHRWFRRTRRDDWVAYLSDFAEDHELVVRAGVTVQRVRREEAFVV
ncbi:MAG: NAD(P)-binding domain-containing protein, partial [Candidatus Eremiobacterota bacterium]